MNNISGEIIKIEDHGLNLDFYTLESEIRKSNLVMIAGRPSTGKTKFALSMVASTIVNRKCSIAIFALEMSKDAVSQWLFNILQSSEIAMRDLGSNSLLIENAVFIDDNPKSNVDYIQATLKKNISKGTFDFIIIDYLQLMAYHNGMNKEEENNEISSILIELNKLAKRFNTTIFVLSQAHLGMEDHMNSSTILDRQNYITGGEYVDIILFSNKNPINDKVELKISKAVQ